MKYKVKAPVPGYCGISAGVAFVNGEGITENAHLAEWFEERGYSVERLKAVKEQEHPPAGEPAPELPKEPENTAPEPPAGEQEPEPPKGKKK